mmetsp:Transcript_6348/g.22626  ORF Transcript_6348/g.22626 Transcript_6348/m.22626 type:complete len:222 (-) Transcript_6348:481-1146(-)
MSPLFFFQLLRRPPFLVPSDLLLPRLFQSPLCLLFCFLPQGLHASLEGGFFQLQRSFLHIVVQLLPSLLFNPFNDLHALQLLFEPHHIPYPFVIQTFPVRESKKLLQARLHAVHIASSSSVPNSSPLQYFFCSSRALFRFSFWNDSTFFMISVDLLDSWLEGLSHHRRTFRRAGYDCTPESLARSIAVRPLRSLISRFAPESMSTLTTGSLPHFAARCSAV